MWPGADTTSTGWATLRQGPYYADVTGGNLIDQWWVRGPVLKKKPFSLAEFLAHKQRVTEAWHEAFKWELLKWRRNGMTQLLLANFLYRRTVEFVVRTWLSVDWRWVFKKWVQDLYAET